MRDTPYATLIEHVEEDGARIERLHIKAMDREEVRFSWWKDGNLATRPLDVTEDHLLNLFRKAVANGNVFSDGFLTDLEQVLASRSRHHA